MNPESPSPDVRTLLHEKLDAMLQDCETVMDNAAFGQTVHNLDDFLIIAGQTFLQEVYQQKLQERIEHTENTAENKQCPQCKKKRITKTKKQKT